jgi:hypothetical protein
VGIDSVVEEDAQHRKEDGTKSHNFALHNRACNPNIIYDIKLDEGYKYFINQTIQSGKYGKSGYNGMCKKQL